MTKIIKNIPQHANTTSTPSTPDAGFSKIYPKTDLKWYLLDENGLETPIGSIEGTLNYIPKWTPDGVTIGNSLIYDSGTNIGIGTITPTAKLDVNGQIVSGLGGGVVTSNDSPFYAVRANTGAPNYYTGWQYTFEVGGGIWGIGMNYVNNQFQFLTNGGSTAKFIYGDGNSAAPNSKFVMDLNGGYFGANITAPTATIHGKGIDNGIVNYTLKVDSSSNPLLYVRNDGIVTVGKTLEISRYGFNTTRAFWVEAEVTTENTLMSTSNADLVFKTRSSGAVETMRMTNAGKVIINDGSYLTLGVLDPSTDKYAYIDSAGNTTASAGLKFSVCHVGTTTGMTAMQIEAGGKVGVNISNPLLTFSVKPTSNLDGIILQEDASNFYCQIAKDGTRGLLALYDGGTPKVFFNSPTYSSGIDFINTGQNLGIGLNAASAKVHIYGDATSSNYALKVDNSAFNPLLYVRNDGNVGIGTSSPTAKLHVVGLLEYTDNADALANGLTIGAFYRTGDLLKVVH